MVARNTTYVISVVLCILGSQAVSSATDYYVNVSGGSDSNSGRSTSAPWRTIAKVNATSFSPGDRIFFARGDIWRETLMPRTSGVAGSPITFGAYGSGALPVLAASDNLSGYTWRKSISGTNTYYCYVAGLQSPDAVWLNGVHCPRGTAGSLADHQWDWNNRDSLSFYTVYIRDDSGSPATSGVLVESAARSYAVHMSGKSYLTFENLELRQSDNLSASVGLFNAMSCTNITVRNCKIHDGVSFVARCHGTGTANIVIENCEIYNALNTWIYSQCLAIRNCRGAQVRGNKIYNALGSVSACVTIQGSSTNVIFEKNEVYHGYGDLVYARDYSYGNTIRYNYLHGTATTTSANAVIFREGANNNLVYGNLIVKASPAYQVSDTGGVTSGNKFFNNTIDNRNISRGETIYVQGNHPGTEIKNNVVYLNSASGDWALWANTAGVVTSDYNRWYNTGSGPTWYWAGTSYTQSQFSSYKTASGQDRNSSVGDPGFVSASDWHLRYGSPCIDSGTNVGLTKDYDGTAIPQGSAPDMGAFEYVQTVTTYTLAVSAANGAVTKTPNQTSYTSGTTVTLLATPNSGYSFTGWSGDLSGTTNPATLVMNSNKSVTANFTADSTTTTEEVGITTVFPNVTKDPPRRAMPCTMAEAGQLQSVSMYHQGGSGQMLLAVYADGSGLPGERLGVTDAAPVQSAEGWQTIALQSPVSVSAGQKIWLAWVFESNPGIRYTQGTPGRAGSSAAWPDGMPTTFGVSTVTEYMYSICASYTPDSGSGTTGKTVGNTTVFSSVATTLNRRAMPYTMPEAGQLQSVAIYHNGGSGGMLLGVYADSSGRPGTRLGVTNVTAVNGAEGWQTVALQGPVSAAAGQTIWLAWLFENSTGVRVTAGTPGRAEASDTWAGGMPTTFGTSTVSDYIYSIYANYTAGTAPTEYTLTTSATNGTITRSPNKTSYTPGETVTLQATPNSGYTFSGWSGALTGTANPASLVMNADESVTANFTASGGGATGTIGTTTVLPQISTTPKRRAMPYTAAQSGQLQSVSIYHQGGSGRMILAVYGDSSGRPGTRLAVTDATTINSAEGWQTAALQSPVSVSAGQKIWLAWVFEKNPGVRFDTGSPGRAESTDVWSGGMPATFGTSKAANYVYSIYASYGAGTGSTTVETVGTTMVLPQISTTPNRRAMPYTALRTGQLQSVSIYHQGGSGRLLLGIYGDSSGRPGTRLGVTNAATIHNSAGWQTVALQSPASVSSGQKIWLAWVFENNPGIRFTSGTPGRAQSSATWSGGMPGTFGASTVANYIYSIYTTYN